MSGYESGRRRVFVTGPRRSTEEEAHLCALAGYAMVRGYDPVVVGHDTDAAGALGAGGGEFWAIEVDLPVVYVPEVAEAYRAWEAETQPGHALRLRRSKTWPMWWEEIKKWAGPDMRLVHVSPDDLPF